MKAKVTITRDNRGKIKIDIRDDASWLKVVEVQMEPQAFALAVTGLGHQPGEFEFTPTDFTVENIGKEKQSMGFYVKKVSDKDKQLTILLEALCESGLAEEGWGVFDDGTRTRQDGVKHGAILRRFVEPEREGCHDNSLVREQWGEE